MKLIKQLILFTLIFSGGLGLFFKCTGGGGGGFCSGWMVWVCALVTRPEHHPGPGITCPTGCQYGSCTGGSPNVFSPINNASTQGGMCTAVSGGLCVPGVCSQSLTVFGIALGTDNIKSSAPNAPTIVISPPVNVGLLFTTEQIVNLYNQTIDTSRNITIIDSKTKEKLNYTLSNTNLLNDTITISPTNTWGNHRENIDISIEVFDNFGNKTQSELSYLLVDQVALNNIMNPKVWKSAGSWVSAQVSLNNGWFLRTYKTGDGWPGIVYYYIYPHIASEVHGAIFQEYANRGMHNSNLGYPTTDEYACGAFGWKRCSNFQFGMISK